MSRNDLLEANAKVVADVTARLVQSSPDCVILVATNPLDEMLALSQTASGLPHRRVIGEAGVLNTARWKHIVAERLGVTPNRVEGIVLGSHGETMVAVPSLTKVDGRPLRDLLDEAEIEALIQETRGCPAEIIAYLKTGSGFHAAAAAGELTVRAIVQDSRRRAARCAPGCAGSTGFATCISGCRPSSAVRVFGRWSNCRSSPASSPVSGGPP